MQKIVFILYFAGLFILLSSYVIFSQADTAVRMSIATSEEFSRDRPNYIRVVVRNLDNGSKFDGYALRTCWRRSAHDPASLGGSCHIAPLASNGIATVQTPVPVALHPEFLCISLLQKGGIEEKSTCIDTRSFRFVSDRNTERNRENERYDSNYVQIKITPAEAEEIADNRQPAESPSQRPGSAATPQNTDSAGNAGNPYSAPVAPVENTVISPGAFLFGVPNEVLIRTWQDGRALTDPIAVKQIYGNPASFLPSAAPSRAGIARLSFALSSPADFELTQNGQKFYASFSPNEKPLHVALSSPMLNPGRQPSIAVTPFGTADRVTIDVYDGVAWIGHVEKDLNENQKISLDTDFSSIINPKILFFRVSTSLFANIDASQTIPVITAPDVLTAAQQARLALDAAIADGASRLEPYRALLSGYSDRELADVRDLALAVLSTQHRAEITVQKRTEVDDIAQFTALKSAHKSIANTIFIAWIALGAVVFSAIGLVHVFARRRAWDALSEPSPEVQKARTFLRVFHVVLIVAMFGALAALLYYMMQLI